MVMESGIGVFVEEKKGVLRGRVENAENRSGLKETEKSCIDRLLQ